MNYFNHAINDKILFYGFLISLSIQTLALLYTLFFFSQLPPFLPLFNQLAWGEERLGTKQELFFPMGIALFVLFFNFFFSNALYAKSPLLSRLLCITSILISIFVLLFMIRTVQIIT